MKKFLVFILVVLCNIGIALGQKIDSELTADMNRSSNQTELFRIIVVMNQQYDQNAMTRKTNFMDKATKRDFVVNEMKRFTSELQVDVLNTLTSNEKSGYVKNIKSYWLFNGFSCEATREVIESLAERKDVKIVCSDKERNMLPKGEEPMIFDGTKGMAWNVTKVNADDVWTYYGEDGYDGTGVVVAVIDTGVNYNHNDIKNNMWDGGSSYPYHGYDFVNSDNKPLDDNGHGTHCAGTVAGDGTSGTQTGMAPGAKIMALKVLNSQGNGFVSDVINAIGFAIEHEADVLSMSFGGINHGGQYVYRNAFVTLLQAGIPAAVAAGNEGERTSLYPVPNNIGSPGNCPPPFLHPDQANYQSGGTSAVICVGATNQSDEHASFTSVGPATWTEGSEIGTYYDYPYTEGSSTEIGLIRPDVAAPGCNIPSLNYSNNSGYCNMDGTSMATPCTAGVMALMLQANPELTPATIDSILEYTAVRCNGSTTKNNRTGSGRIDAYEAVRASLDSYLTLTALEDNTVIGLYIVGEPNISTLQYSYDGSNWNYITGGITFNTLDAGQYIKFRSQNQVTNDYSNCISFGDSGGSYKVSGNINTLINYRDIYNVTLNDFAFIDLFSYCSRLTDASELLLPATTLAEECYRQMFYRCTSLTKAPSLPATTLAEDCYLHMFNGCTSLVEAPELPATNLGFYCYCSMFSGCISLTEAPSLPATILNNGCYYGMFSGCTSLTKAPSLPATILNNSCYYGMFSGCTSLTKAPSLPATTLYSYCYESMFEDCTSLTEAPELLAITLANRCYRSMFKNCTSLTEAPVSLPATVLDYCCYEAMFSGCTSLTEAPKLPAITLANGCYGSMFEDCASLTKAPSLPATSLQLYPWCYYQMFSRCTSLTKAPSLPATTLYYHCYDQMFSGCTSLVKAPELPAMTLAQGCYESMFKDCTSLSFVVTHATTWNANHACNWLAGVSETGNFYNLGNADIPTGTNGIPEGWTEHTAIDYFTITALADNTVVGLDIIDSPDISTLQYTYNGYNWNDITDDIIFNALQNGQYIKFRSQNQVSSGALENYINFSDYIGSYRVSGNINTLIDYSEVDNVTLENYAFSNLFYDCTKLTDASELLLPATTLAEGCYESMFRNCTSLVEAPELPATTLAETCYHAMFMGCSSLIEAPKLPATTLANDCYSLMFFLCTSLTDAPTLPATTLTSYCYCCMFEDCTSLTEAPELPATTLGFHCYEAMFSGCTSLTEAPTLPATTLTSGCYKSMFWRCSSLTEAPVLPAMTLAQGCYESMFNDCTSLSFVATDATDWNTGYAYNWLANVSATGDFYNLGGADISMGASGIPEGWTEHTAIDYFTITALADNTVVGLDIIDSPDISTLQYTYNGYNWNDITDDITFNTLQNGQYIKFRSQNQVSSGALENYINFSDYSGSYKVSGNINTLINYNDVDNVTLENYAFSNLFYDCTNLTDASELLLPATTLAEGCYEFMFMKCTSLVEVPELPATTLAEGCYSDMFAYCTSLTEAPELPATTLAEGCYYDMFGHCTSLTEAPELPAMTLAGGCYTSMFWGCSSLIEAPELPATTLALGCYSCMFWDCTSLTEAPELPVNTLAEHCYFWMFFGCSSLTKAPELSATTLAEYCYSGMFESCTSLTEAPELPADTLAENCYSYMFSGCTSLTEAPELPADTLAENCYSYMFSGCTSLTKAPELPATTLAEGCYTSMFENCSSLSLVVTHVTTWETDYACNWLAGVSETGDFYNIGNADIPTGTNGIPEGWNKHTTAPITITASANNSDYGTVSGSGLYVEGKTCTLIATPNTGYTFVNWTENDNIVSTNASYTFTVTAARNLVANFQTENHWTPDPSLYADNMGIVAEIHIDNVLQTSSDIEIGAFCGSEVRGSQRIKYEPVPIDKYLVFLTVYGESNDNITFKIYNHQNNEELVCRISQSVTFTPNGTIGDLINPYVVECFTTANITAVANPSIGGTVSGAGVHSVGETVTLTATANEFYRFVNWTENDDEVSTSETYSFTAFDDRSLVANFEINNHWVPDPSLYADNMSIVGEIQIDGVTQTSSDIEIGAFCGSEVRGSQKIEYKPSPIDKYLVFLTVYGESNDNITFKLYNHQTESEYELTAPAAITFSPNANIGGLDNPHIFNFCHTQNRELTSGWNWYSTYIDIEGEDGFNMLTTGLGENGLQVKSQSQFALYYPDYNIWTGSLHEADNTKLYMIQMSGAHTLNMTGALANAASHPISISNGWKWIGYPVSQSMSIESALANFTPHDGDYIKSQTGFSQYYEGVGWLGALSTLTPGNGYMYQNTSGTAKTLTYATPGKSEAYGKNMTPEGNHWEPDMHQYADNMSVIAVVSVNGELQNSGSLEIGAFCNGECRGSARPMFIEQLDKYVVFLTVYGNENDEIVFRLFDAENNEEFEGISGNMITFVANGTIGSISTPYAINFGFNAVGEQTVPAIRLYPNPANRSTEILLNGNYDSVEIFNSIGIKVAEYQKVDRIKGIETTGVYVVRFTQGEFVGSQRLVIK